ARGEGVYVKLPRGRPTSSRGARAGRPPGAAGGEGEVRFSVKAVLRAIEALSSRAATFRATGGTHVAAVANREGELVTFAEDVGRHNAIDKAIGEGAIKRVDFSRSMLAFSGRLSYEVVAKVASVGVPVLASVAAPTDRGLRLAEALGLTLIGFARGGRFNVYTSPSRIEEYARLIDSRGS
ncbi:MAG: formate dehydrogenase accessory sulfurtransferase FdhD, partial [Candidatus Nezhaarchaeota archaeon]|nr:formate dehydrogenase accessory sulfurtransferase FdhD [Candidatus Nezhaarchaeota archaeon]